MPTSLAISAPAADLSHALRRRGLADVLDTTKLTRALYSSDASVYRVVPLAVARPRSVEELLTVLDAARSLGMPVTTRGAGTSCAGNAVGPGLVVDVARHLNRIHQVDAGGATRRRRSGRGAGLPAAGGGAVRAAVRARSVDPHPLHDRRDDRQQRLRTAGAGLRQDGRQRHRPGGRHRVRGTAHPRPSHTGGRGLLGVAARPAVGGRGPPRHHADRVRHLRSTGLGLQPGAPAAGEAVRRHPVPGRHRGHPGGDHQGDRPAGRGRAAQDHDRARLRRPWPRPRTRPRPCSRFAPTAIEGLDRRIVDVVRRTRGDGAVPPLPRGDGWVFVELVGDDPGELARGPPRCWRRPVLWTACVVDDPARPSRCGRSARTAPVWPGSAWPSPRTRAGRTPPCRRRSSAPTCGTSTPCWTDTDCTGCRTGISVTAACTSGSTSR